MKEYFLAVIVVALLGGVILSLLPDGSSGRCIRLLCGLCVSACVVMPLVSFAGESEYWLQEADKMFSDASNESNIYDEIYKNALAEAEVKNAGIYLKNEMIQALSLEKGDFDINIVIDKITDEKYSYRAELIIYASGLAMDPHGAKEYIEERLRCDVSVIYEFYK